MKTCKSVFLLIGDSNDNCGPKQSQSCAYEGLCVTIYMINTGTVFVCVCLSVCLSVPCKILGTEGRITAFPLPA